MCLFLFLRERRVVCVRCLTRSFFVLRCSRRVEFTEEDRSHLAYYLATRYPKQDGRFGNNAYKDLERLVRGLARLLGVAWLIGCTGADR